jgi:hypothetical protein
MPSLTAPARMDSRRAGRGRRRVRQSPRRQLRCPLRQVGVAKRGSTEERHAQHDRAGAHHHAHLKVVHNEAADTAQDAGDGSAASRCPFQRTDGISSDRMAISTSSASARPIRPGAHAGDVGRDANRRYGDRRGHLAEDASFAGQYVAVLDLHGADAALDALRPVSDVGFGDRVRDYRGARAQASTRRAFGEPSMPASTGGLELRRIRLVGRPSLRHPADQGRSGCRIDPDGVIAGPERVSWPDIKHGGCA